MPHFIPQFYIEYARVLLQTQEKHNDETPLCFKICNYSSVCVYVIQFFYASYTLYLLLAKNERSVQFIGCVLMILYSCITLTVMYATANTAIWDDSEDLTLPKKLFFIMFYELAFLFVFLAHWIIFYQYLELALVLPILSKIAEFAQDAHNKIISIRQCLLATRIIVVAILVAHFVDKAFYTVKKSSTMADDTITYFAIVLRVCLIIMISYDFVRLYIVITADPMLQINNIIYRTHVAALFLYFIFWTAYETCYMLWEFEPNYEKSENDWNLIILCVITLLFNTFTVALNFLLFYMINKMT